MNSQELERRLEKATSAMSAYSSGIRQIVHTMREIAEPIQERMRGASEENPPTKADLQTINALTQIMTTIEKVVDDVGKIIGE